jgi:hypothetical protein
MPSLWWCPLYVLAGACSFAFFAAHVEPKPPIHVVKVKVLPVLIEGPKEVRR